MSNQEPPGGFEPPSPPPAANPYGQQPPPPPPYGHQPYGQQPAYGVAQPYYGAPPPGTMSTIARPGTVVAGSVIAMVLCSLAALAYLFLFVMILAIDDAVNDIVGLGLSGGDKAVMVLIVLGLLTLCAVGITAAAFAIGGSNPWRITLVVLSSITALIGILVGLGSIADDAGGAILTLVWGLLAVLVIVFMFVNGANAWFASNPRRK